MGPNNGDQNRQVQPRKRERITERIRQTETGGKESKAKGQSNRGLDTVQSAETTDAPNRCHRSLEPRIQADVLRTIRRRFPRRNQRGQNGSRGDESSNWRLSQQRTPIGTLTRENTGDERQGKGSISGIRYQALVRNPHSPLPGHSKGTNTTHRHIQTQPLDAAGQNRRHGPRIRKPKHLAWETTKQAAQPQ